MFGLSNTFKILNRIVEFVAIYVVNDVIRGNRSFQLLPDESVKHSVSYPEISAPKDELFPLKLFHKIPRYSYAYNDMKTGNYMKSISYLLEAQ